MKTIKLALALLVLASLYSCGVKHSITTPPHTPVEPPERPSSLQGLALSSSSIQLTWNDNSNNEEYFAIYRREGISDFDTFAVCQRVFFNTTTCTDEGLRDSTTYSYYVTAERGDTCSRPSNTVSVMTMAQSQGGDGHITVVGALPFPGAGAHMDNRNADRFAIATRSGMVYLVDVSDSTAPQILESYQAPGEVFAIDYQTCYILAMGDRGVQGLGMTPPAPPQVLGNCDTPGSAIGVCHPGYILDLHTYVVDGASIQILDGNVYPDIVAEFRSPVIPHIDDAVCDWSHAYLACGDSGVQILNISNVLEPFIIGHLNIAGGARKVCIDQQEPNATELFVLNVSLSLNIINVANSSNPTVISTFEIGPITRAIYVSGNYAYVSFRDGLRMIDISNPAEPRQIVFFLDNHDISAVKVFGDFIYMVDNDGLKILRYTPGS